MLISYLRHLKNTEIIAKHFINTQGTFCGTDSYLLNKELAMGYE